MIAQFLILAVIPAALLAAACWDLASYTIPNAIPALLLAAFALFALAAGMPLAALCGHLGAAAIGLAAGFALFAFGFIGGGDAKLFAAVALLFGPKDMLSYALLASVFGGGLTIALLFLRSLPLPQPLAQQGWLLRLHEEGEGVPYGVALSAAAFVLLPYGDLLRLAAS